MNGQNIRVDQPHIKTPHRDMTASSAVHAQDRLGQAGIHRSITTGQSVFRAGDPVEHGFELIDGLVIVWAMLPDERRQILQVVGAGTHFGFSASAMHHATAEAVIASKFRAHPLPGSYLRADECTSRLRQALLRIDALEAHAVRLGQMTALEKVSHFLLSLVPDGSETSAVTDGDRPVEIQVFMTREEIGDYLGLKIETVSRNFGKLRRMRLIEMTRADRIQLLDLRGLRSIVQDPMGA